MIYPLIVTLVALSFAGILSQQYVRRRRPYQLVWTISLTLGGLAGLCFLLFLEQGRDVVFFRLYYLAGALLMAPCLGLGSIYLLAPRRLAHGTSAVVGVLALLGTVLILWAPVDTAILRGPNVEAGASAISGPAIAVVAVLNTFGAVAVIGGAVYSAWRLWRHQGPGHILAANVLIAGGTLLASLAGTLARVTGQGSAFWGLLAFGFVVLFGGFLLTTVTAARVPRDEPRPLVADHPGPDAV